MSLSARQQLTTTLCARYREARRPAKQKILDEFVAATGYHRKYAISILKQDAHKQPSASVRHRARTYTAEVKDALVAVWRASNQLCSKRLVPFLPELVPALERHGHLSVSDETRTTLLGISPATTDRLLSEFRRPGRRRRYGSTRPGSLLKHQIQVRTFADWDDLAPGFVEADLVAHCGTTAHGAFLNSLVLTDVSTGWTECLALLFRGQHNVIAALGEARELLPFPLLGLDTDNGGEFLNSELLRYCRTEKITFTRCRPYKKNDQCHVEQKNGAIVRRIIGYDRYEGVEACRALASVYGVLRLYNNFFQPSVKLVSKERTGSQVTKKYDKAQTPYQRVLASVEVGEIIKESLQSEYEKLDPVELLRQVEHTQNLLWQYAHRPATSVADNALAQTPIAIVDKVPQLQRRQLSGAETTNKVPYIEVDSRHYRATRKERRKMLTPRSWRTRPDAFVAVWRQVEEQLERNSSVETKQLFQHLQRLHPGKFKDTQLRTLQRRVRAWREARSVPCAGVLLPTHLLSTHEMAASESKVLT